jgi:anaerobic ribonucleoside-triphosphate reductase activating protein
MDENIFLNIAMTLPRSRANGPGQRAVIWVQGCTIGCPGCYNSFTHPHQSENISSPTDLANWINSIEDIEGITFSGGEPFEQAFAVTKVIELVNSEREVPLSVFIFTGFDFEILSSSTNEVVQKLLSLTDMLSAGPYIVSERDTELLWRGSSNQKLIYCSNVYSSQNETFWKENSPVEELVMSESGILRTGFLATGGDLYNSLININP